MTSLKIPWMLRFLLRHFLLHPSPLRHFLLHPSVLRYFVMHPSVLHPSLLHPFVPPLLMILFVE
jgi:hypothetical protein